MTLRKKLVPSAIAASALALVAALTLNATNAVADSAGLPTEPEVVPNEAILTFEDAATAERVLASAESSDALEAEVLADDLNGKTVIALTSENAAKAQALIGAAEALPGVTAQPNYVYQLIDGETEEITADTLGEANGLPVDPLTLPTNFPNDYHAGLQYYLLELGNGVSSSGSNVFEAWDLMRQQPEHGTVTVAVTDSGANLDHEDLQGQLRGDLAYNAFDGSRNVEDQIGHGTGVSGVIAASANNEVGIAGVASAVDDLVSVVPVKIFGDSDETTTDVIVKGLDYLDGLIEDGTLDDLRVVNMSLGLYYEDGRPADSAMLDLIDHMTTEHGVLTVASGGNGDEDQNALTTPMYPSDDELCLSVTSLTETGANAWFSDYNLDKDISAPGVDIATTSSLGNDTYEYSAGTSYSAPIASGVAALMFAADPTLTPAEVIEIIKATAVPLPDTSEYNWGELTGSAGALDAGAAVRETLRRAGAELPEVPADGIAVYRLYNANSSEHLFTTDRNEYETLGALGWNREGVAWWAPKSGEPVYRVYNPNNGDHLYTTDEAEYRALCDAGWNGEDVKMWSSGANGLPIYRLFNPWQTENAGAYAHLWTADKTEHDQLAADGWLPEGTAWHALG